jgi:rSAM/selenodomain-associated transferase 1
MKNRDICIIFIKYPESGRVKTRLGQTLGMEKAANLYKKLVEDVLVACKSDKYDLCVCIDPPERSRAFQEWLGDYMFLSQQGKDLGDKMQNAFESVFKKGYNRCIVAGSDIPELCEEIICRGFDALAKHDTVLGESVDGGYYLVGVSAETKEYSIFNNMIWSTDTVLAETIAKLKAGGRSYFILDALQDIDTEADLLKFGDRFV